MAATKSASTLLTSQSLAASTSVNATELNLSTAYAARVFVKLTNGATAPSSAPTVTFYSGEASGVKRVLYQASGDTVNSSVNDIYCLYELPDMFCNCTITNGASQPITVEAYAQVDTGI